MNTSNVSVTLRWEDPGGEVDAFIIQLTITSRDNESFNVTVNGSFTFHTLTDLNPDTSYNVVIFTVNGFGSSIASPLHFITTNREHYLSLCLSICLSVSSLKYLCSLFSRSP